MQQWRQIQAWREEGLADAAIARRLGIDRETVSRWRGEPVPGAITRNRASRLDEHREYIEKRLAAFPDLSARVLLREVQARGYEGGYERVKLMCRELRGPRPLELTSRFETGPGEQAQADFLESKHYVEHEGRRRRPPHHGQGICGAPRAMSSSPSRLFIGGSMREIISTGHDGLAPHHCCFAVEFTRTRDAAGAAGVPRLRAWCSWSADNGDTGRTGGRCRLNRAVVATTPTRRHAVGHGPV